jgi:2-acylglycerol O-acyltransferase 2
VLGTQLFFMLVPVSDKSRIGRKIARFASSLLPVRFFPQPACIAGWISHPEGARICCRFVSQNVIGHFPVTLHVENYQAFDPKRAYGELSISGCLNHHI